jgi:hypothetical protein
MNTPHELSARSRHGDIQTRTSKWKRLAPGLHRPTLTLGPKGAAHYVSNRAVASVHPKGLYPQPSKVDTLL